MDRERVVHELEQHHQAAFGWAVHCCGGDVTVAEDVVQDSYLKLLDGRARFAGRSAFRTFLFGIVRRTAAEHQRRAALRRLISLTSFNGRPPPEMRIDPAAPDPEPERLREMILALPRRQRDVLHLVFYQEMSIADAAGILGVSVGTARTHYTRGKDALRRRLESP